MFIQCRSNYQTGCCRRAGNQVDHRLMADQRSAAPVFRDEAEQSMLDFVPLARSRRKMTDAQPQTNVVSQFLQSHFPQARPAAVAAAAIGGDQQFAGAGKTPAAHILPPTTNGTSGEVSRVMIDADANPTLIVGYVIHSVRNGLAQRRVLKVVDPHFFRLSLRLPFLTGILEIPN